MGFHLFWITLKGGDVEFKDGNGGVSIYGKTFEDENFAIGNYVKKLYW